MIRIKSYSRQNGRLHPVEVEVQLLPGLPLLHILGSPGPVVRESAIRIKSAVLSQGFKWPRTQQIVVNLQPSSFRKDDRGVELAIAAGLIWVSEQLPKPSDQNICLYGGVDLSGKVFVEDEELPILGSDQLLLWTASSAKVLGRKSWRVNQLRDLARPEVVEADLMSKPERPALPRNIMLTPEQALVLGIAATGKHSLLLAGPSGTGKSMSCDLIWRMLPEPSEAEWIEISAGDSLRDQNSWRPFVCPHHTSTVLSIVGGGARPQAGEAARAHGGILVLDELLEWEARVQEALREPVEKGVLRVARAQGVFEQVCKFQLLATTNLCPCGSFVPGASSGCRCSGSRVRRYLSRLSGPILDRFDLVVTTARWSEKRTVSLESVFERVTEIFKLRHQAQARGEALARPSTEIPVQELGALFGARPLAHVAELTAGLSVRRLHSLLRTSVSICEWEGLSRVQERHVNLASELTGTFAAASLFNLRFHS